MVNEDFTTYSSFNSGFPDNSILGLARDTIGIVWMSCPSGGLVRYYSGLFSAYNMSTSLIQTNSLNSLLVDSLQNIYLASYDQGLLKKTGVNFTSWNMSNSPMPDNLVYGLAQERNGILWMGTATAGVVRFDEAQWNIIDEPGNKIKNIQIWPNPAADQLNIISNSKIQSVLLTDPTGIVVMSENKMESLKTTIDISDLASGLYFLHVNSAGNEESYFKIVRR